MSGDEDGGEGDGEVGDEGEVVGEGEFSRTSSPLSSDGQSSPPIPLLVFSPPRLHAEPFF